MSQALRDAKAQISPGEYLTLFLGIHPRKPTGNVSICCPFHSDRSPSLNICMNTGKFYCFGCGASGGDVIDFHRRLTGCGFKQAVSELGMQPSYCPPPNQPERSISEPDEQLLKFMHNVWDNGSDLQRGDRVDLYLRSRGLKIEHYPTVLRVHSSLKYKHDDVDYGFFPAMLAKVESNDGELVCVHRTYLSPVESGKAAVPKPKKLMPCAISGATKGAAIRLFPAANRLAVAEGIETALAFSQLTNLPSWATISAGGMEAVLLPKEVEEVIICVDRDLKGRGERSADLLAQRLLAEGRRVFKAIPPGELLAGSKSKDWLDFLVEVQASQNEIDKVKK